MNDSIRAMSMGEILDLGFRIVKDRFGIFLGLAVIGYLPLGLLMVAGGLSTGQVPDPAELAVSLGGIFLYSLLVMPIVVAATNRVAGDWILGREISLVDSLRFGASIYLQMVGTFFVWYLAILGIVGGIAALSVVAVVAGPFGIVLGLVAVVAGVWVFLGITLVVQVMVLERTFGVHPLRRSWELVNGYRGRALGVTAVVIVLTMILQVAFTLPLSPFPSISPIAQYLASGLGQALSAAALCGLYVDLRCRNEAFDLEHLARQVGEPDEAAASGASRSNASVGPDGELLG